ncbi:TonB-dependent receptor [Pseudoduganella sp. LjRoot289]|uniref:TonB-dependent receptor plug domain-containing protein n=1 Tax=Pseudoduganella sp. LjRoot289 TaxID=3342314 RepID=UPI003ED01739
MIASISPALAAPWRFAFLLAVGTLPAWAAGMAAPVSAPEPGQATLDSSSEELASLPLEQLMALQVVTSASRFQQSIAEAPSAVVVLTAQDIRDFGWRTLADALASLPGLYVTNDRNYSYLGARGFLRPGDYDSRFLLLVDGVRNNDSVYDQASIGSEGLLDMDLVERIEYVPGPGSAVYGSNALFGVINVITKAGSAMAGAQAAATAGSYGERGARFSYGWHSQDGTDWLLAASSQRRDGQDLYYAEYEQPGVHDGVARGLDDDRVKRVFAKAARGGWSLSAAYADRVKGVPTGSFGAQFNAPNYTRDAQAIAKAAYAGQLYDGVELAAMAYWGRADYLGVGSYPDAADIMRINVDGDHAMWYGLSAHLTLTRFQDHKIVAGGEVQRNARRDQFNFNLGPYEQLLEDRRKGDRSGVFLEDEWRLSPGLLLNAGLRYDSDSNVGGQFSPRVALMAQVDPADTVKLIYGTAYRVPNAYEQYYAVAGVQQASPGLSAEKISTRELIFERRLDASSMARLSLFRYRMRGLITQELEAGSGVLVFANVDHATAMGAEAAYERQFERGLRLRASLAVQHSDDGGKVQPVNSPRRLAKFNAAVPVPALRARVAAELQCVSARRTEHAYTGGHCVSNLTASSTRLLPRTEVSLALYNAFDARYADPAGPAFVQEALERQSRTLAVKLVFGF